MPPRRKGKKGKNGAKSLPGTVAASQHEIQINQIEQALARHFTFPEASAEARPGSTTKTGSVKKPNVTEPSFRDELGLSSAIEKYNTASKKQKLAALRSLNQNVDRFLQLPVWAAVNPDTLAKSSLADQGSMIRIDWRSSISAQQLLDITSTIEILIKPPCVDRLKKDPNYLSMLQMLLAAAIIQNDSTLARDTIIMMFELVKTKELENPRQYFRNLVLGSSFKGKEVECANLLVASNAKCDAKMIAAIGGLYVELGGSIDYKGSNGISALHQSCHQMITAYTYNVLMPILSGQKPKQLELKALTSCVEKIHFLISKGASLPEIDTATSTISAYDLEVIEAISVVVKEGKTVNETVSDLVGKSNKYLANPGVSSKIAAIELSKTTKEGPQVDLISSLSRVIGTYNEDAYYRLKHKSKRKHNPADLESFVVDKMEEVRTTASVPREDGDEKFEKIFTMILEVENALAQHPEVNNNSDKGWRECALSYQKRLTLALKSAGEEDLDLVLALADQGADYIKQTPVETQRLYYQKIYQAVEGYLAKESCDMYSTEKFTILCDLADPFPKLKTRMVAKTRDIIAGEGFLKTNPYLMSEMEARYRKLIPEKTLPTTEIPETSQSRSTKMLMELIVNQSARTSIQKFYTPRIDRMLEEGGRHNEIMILASMQYLKRAGSLEDAAVLCHITNHKMPMEDRAASTLLAKMMEPGHVNSYMQIFTFLDLGLLRTDQVVGALQVNNPNTETFKHLVRRCLEIDSNCVAGEVFDKGDLDDDTVLRLHLNGAKLPEGLLPEHFTEEKMLQFGDGRHLENLAAAKGEKLTELLLSDETEISGAILQHVAMIMNSKFDARSEEEVAVKEILSDTETQKAIGLKVVKELGHSIARAKDAAKLCNNEELTAAMKDLRLFCSILPKTDPDCETLVADLAKYINPHLQVTRVNLVLYSLMQSIQGVTGFDSNKCQKLTIQNAFDSIPYAQSVIFAMEEGEIDPFTDLAERGSILQQILAPEFRDPKLRFKNISKRLELLGFAIAHPQASNNIAQIRGLLPQMVELATLDVSTKRSKVNLLSLLKLDVSIAVPDFTDPTLCPAKLLLIIGDNEIVNTLISKLTVDHQFDLTQVQEFLLQHHEQADVERILGLLPTVETVKTTPPAEPESPPVQGGAKKPTTPTAEEKRVNDLESKTAKLKAQSAELKTKLEELSSRSKDLLKARYQKMDLESLFDLTLDRGSHDLVLVKEAIKEKIEAQETKEQRTEAVIQKLRKESQSLGTRLGATTTELNTLRQKSGAKESKQQNKLKKTDAKLQAMLKEKDAAQRHAASLTQKATRSQSEKQDLERENEKLQSDLARLRERFVQSEAGLAAKTKENSKLAQDYKQSQAVNAGLEGQNKTLRSREVKLQQKFEKALKAAQEKSTKFEKQLVQSIEEKSQLTASHAAAQTATATSELQKQQYEQALTSAAEQKLALEAEILRLREEVAKTTQELAAEIHQKYAEDLMSLQARATFYENALRLNSATQQPAPTTTYTATHNPHQQYAMATSYPAGSYYPTQPQHFPQPPREQVSALPAAYHPATTHRPKEPARQESTTATGNSSTAPAGPDLTRSKTAGLLKIPPGLRAKIQEGKREMSALQGAKKLPARKPQTAPRPQHDTKVVGASSGNKSQAEK